MNSGMQGRPPSGGVSGGDGDTCKVRGSTGGEDKSASTRATSPLCVYCLEMRW